MSDAPLHAKRPRLGHARLIVVALAVVAIGCGLAVVINGLIGRSAASGRQVERALQVAGAVREIDGLEWRAAAGEDLDGVSQGVRTTFDELTRLLGEMKLRDSELEASTGRYASAIDDMLGALSSGDTDAASEIDETRVDPEFEKVIELADEIVAAESASAAKSRDTSQRLVWLISLTLTVALGASFLVIDAMRRRREERALVGALDRRFRAMVEGSLDVITVVSSLDEVTVVSPTLGPLRDIVTAASPRRVSEIVPDEMMSRWREVDDQIREGGGHRRMEISVPRPDGSLLHLQADGSLLDAQSGERAWVWRDVSAQKDLELQLTHQAFHDGLTGAANRSLLRNRADHALRLAARSNEPVAMLFCDLDDFKAINDTLGHRAGDELLQTVAKRLTACVRDTDTVARLGGDEFAILLEGVDLVEATALADRILSVVGYEISLDSWSISPSMSIGVAAATPGATPDDLVRSADVAMYSAKRAGKRRVHAYEQQMLGASSDALELQNDLKFALERDELALYFQPTIEIESGMVNGVEALLRWRHPVRGSVAPDQFIPLAEAGGTINAIGRWVIEQACSAAAALQQGSDRSIQMSVNLSPRQLHDPTICQVVRDAIAATGIDPALLVFEVTEGELLDDGLAIRRLRDLRALGVRIAIDDFGTGYTSINYLQSLPVDILKIDRAFVSGDALEPDERNAFLSALVSLARSLDLTSVAEGIEAPDQLADLKRLGCDVGQGFYWSPAMPMDELQARIASINGHTGSLVPASGTAG